MTRINSSLARFGMFGYHVKIEELNFHQTGQYHGYVE